MGGSNAIFLLLAVSEHSFSSWDYGEAAWMKMCALLPSTEVHYGVHDCMYFNLSFEKLMLDYPLLIINIDRMIKHLDTLHASGNSYRIT